jgi:hypothetical protein
MINKIEIEINKSSFWSGDRWGGNLTKVIESVYHQTDGLMLHSYSSHEVWGMSYCLKNIKKFNLDRLKHKRVFIRDLRMFHEEEEKNFLKDETSEFLKYFTGDLDIYLPFYVDCSNGNKWITNLGNFFSHVEENFDVINFIKFSDMHDYKSISKTIIRDIRLSELF